MLGIPSRGQRKYENCQARTEPIQQPNTMAFGLLRGIESFYGWFAATNDPNIAYLREATLTCAKLGQVSMETNGTAEQAKNALVRKIGQETCRTCVFANMSLPEVKQRLDDVSAVLSPQQSGDIVPGEVIENHQ